MKTLAFDIGGTGCQWIEFDSNFKEVNSGEFSTINLDKDQVLDKIALVINKYNSSEIRVGISSPTAINAQTGYAYGISGIKNYGNFNLYDELAKRVETKVLATNDANAALLGTIFFEKQKVRNAALVTLGTGVGGALMINSQIVEGKDGFAGEFGYGLMFDNDLNVSQNISTNALVKMVQIQTGKELNGKEILTIYKNKSDNEIVLITDEWLTKVSRFLSFLTYSLNVEIIFLGGGISSNEFFLEQVRELMQKEFKNYGVSKIMPIITKAKEGGKAGLYGAAALWDCKGD